MNSNNKTNKDGTRYIAYVFAEVRGFSKFGAYVGNNNADGPFIYCGFKPAWVMVKSVDATGNWFIMDNARSDINVANEILFADLINLRKNQISSKKNQIKKEDQEKILN